jgi:hypothetical protein
MNDRYRWLTRPVHAWRRWVAAVTERADAEAIALGLTVEVLPGGVRRYRDPRLDELAAHRAVTAGPVSSANRIADRRTEHGGPSWPGGAGAVPALTVPRQGRCGFASASHATACGGPGPGTPSSAGS